MATMQITYTIELSAAECQALLVARELASLVAASGKAAE
jgi:hypothetical protein